MSITPTRFSRTLTGLAVAIRLAMGALLWSPVDSALTWDDFTRVLIARNWAADPFVSADIVWLPTRNQPLADPPPQ